MLIIYYILILALRFIHNENIVTLNLDYSNNKYSLDLHFKKEEKTFKGYINTYLPYSVFSEGQFSDKMLPSRKIKNNILRLINNHDAIHYQSDTNIERYSFNNFSLYFSIDDLKYYGDQGLGFAFKYEDDSFSFVHHLYHNKIIEHLQFTIHTHQEKERALLYIGGIPNNKEKDYKYKAAIDINENSNLWGFQLSQVKFNDIVYPFHSFSFIHTSFNEIFWSNDLYDLFVNSILKEEIKNKNCFVKDVDIVFKWVECKEDFEALNKTIEIQLGNILLKTKLVDLFDHEIARWRTLVKTNPFDSFKTSNVIGIDFLKLFNMTTFDYGNKKVVLYSARPIIFEVINMNKSVIIILYIVIIVICLCELVIMVLGKMINKS